MSGYYSHEGDMARMSANASYQMVVTKPSV